jgi:putative polyketide hydroxylase
MSAEPWADLAVRVLSYAPWDTAAQVADTFTAGRVFLIGDAARVMPPTGGMGGNSAIGDAYSLAWKLAMAAQVDPATFLFGFRYSDGAFDR